jgi:uncharacterized protein (TIGR02147 family)
VNGQNLSAFLTGQLEQRLQRNPRYSLRAFARDLGLSPAMLSQVLAGTKGLSATAASRIARSLGLNEDESRRWVTLVESRHARSRVVRAAARKTLKTLESSYTPLDGDAFRVIADWHHLAILSLLETEGSRDDEAWIARRLGITVLEVRESLKRLKRLEMIESRGGKLKPTGVFFANPAGIPSRSVRSFHSQMLRKAEAALELQATDERDFSTLVLAVDGERLEEAKAAIREFRDAFEARFCGAASAKREVYALGIQYFRITNPSRKKESL